RCVDRRSKMKHMLDLVRKSQAAALGIGILCVLFPVSYAAAQEPTVTRSQLEHILEKAPTLKRGFISAHGLEMKVTKVVEREVMLQIEQREQGITGDVTVQGPVETFSADILEELGEGIVGLVESVLKEKIGGGGGGGGGPTCTNTNTNTNTNKNDVIV